jgi:hypothetical protein
MTNLFKNINNLQTVANCLRTLANTFIATNSQLSTNLYTLADNVIEEMNTISRKINENDSQTTQNTPNTTLVDVELASKSIPTAALTSNFCEQFNSNCACLNCHPIDYCVEDPCVHCDGPTNIICEPPNLTDDFEFCEKCGNVIEYLSCECDEKPTKMKVCLVCRTLLYFPLKKCPKCMRDTTTVLIER